MEYAVHTPPAHLRPYVKYFWSLDNSAGEILPPIYKSMADGCAEVVFATNGSFKEYFQYSSYLLPQHAKHRSVTLGKEIGLFGVRLRPNAVQPLFGISSGELVDNVHELRDVMPHDLVEDVCETKRIQRRIEKICRYLTKKLNHTPAPFEKVIHLLVESRGQARVAELRELTGLSERQFERKFKSIIGFTPKHFSRIIRFQHTRKKFIAQPKLSFAELAYQCNYADQSHFIREFKEFSGMGVSEYFNLVNDPGSEEARVIRGLMMGKDEPYTHYEQHDRAQLMLT